MSNMKFIITESQFNLVGLEKKSDLLYKLMQSFFPENYEYENSNNETEVFANENNIELLFFYDWDTKAFHIGANFINELYEATEIPFLNVAEAQRIQNRPMFDELMKVFAKRHYGWDVNKVWFHFY